MKNICYLKFSILILAVSFTSFQELLSQEKEDIHSIILKNRKENTLLNHGIQTYNFDQANPIQTFRNLIALYQEFISSQDQDVCNFEPSCSAFGSSAIQKAGLIKGILLTSDRLQRCQPIGPKRYLTNEKLKFIDPVDSYLDP